MWKFVLLLTISNGFMNLAWYGHLKFRTSPLWMAILGSWGLALFEYAFQVPANRIGSETLSLSQMKILQECITLVVFSLFAFITFGEALKWNNALSFMLLIGAVVAAFWGSHL